MDCPICHVTLLMADRQGVEIDYCPKCRGIWLDRGELEKLVDLSISNGSSKSTQKEPERHYREKRPKYRDDSDYRREKPKKRESWLSELFDVFD